MKKNKFIKIFSIIVSLVILLQTFNINVFSQVDDPIVYDITDYETIFEIGNIGGVDNSPTNETIFSFEKDVIIQSITTYHWNYAQGKEPGSISIATLDGTIVGTWEATTRPGMYEVPNAYWDVFPFIHLDAGIQYKIIDSDPSTWAHNYESNYTGFVDIRGLILDDPIVYDITDYETIFEIGNIGGVDNSPTNETIFSFEKDVIIQSITTYHWNYAQGKEPGSISIATLDGTIVGTWEATTRPGMYEVPNAYWDVFPFIHLDAGIQYKIIDSDPSTWAHNYESNYTGFVDIRGLILDDPNPPIIYGDINGDNNIDNLDLVTLCQYLIKTSEFNEKQMQCADTSKDNQVDIADLALLKQHLMGDNILNQITYT